VRGSRQLTNANDLYRDCAVETPLPGAEYHTLTAATDFLKQFVIAEFSGHLLRGEFFFTTRLGIRVHAAIKVKESPQSQPPQLVLKERRLGQPATYYL
jgi:hypothetical protein